MQIFYEFCVLTLWLFFPASFSFFCYIWRKGNIFILYMCIYGNRKDINISASSHKSACLLLFSNPCCIHNIYWELADCTRKTSSSIDITHYCYPIEERKRSSSSHNSSIVFIYIEWVSELGTSKYWEIRTNKHCILYYVIIMDDFCSSSPSSPPNNPLDNILCRFIYFFCSIKNPNWIDMRCVCVC